jgi:hypothetical protein
VLVLAAVAGIGANVALMTTAVGRQALVDQWERTASAFGQELDDAQYARLQAVSESGAVGYAVASGLLSGPLVTFGVAFVLKAAARTASLRQTMAVATHAGVILAVRQVIAAPMNYVRESTASATSLGSLFTVLDESSPAARFLGALDLFVIWWAIVLAIGVSVLLGKRARTLAGLFVGVYAALALLLAIVMMVTGGSA